MATEVQYAHPIEPFRWKLFLLIFLIMGSITVGAIVLALIANRSHGDAPIPSSESVSQVNPLPHFELKSRILSDRRG